jgi:hypothetical protein
MNKNKNDKVTTGLSGGHCDKFNKYLEYKIKFNKRNHGHSIKVINKGRSIVSHTSLINSYIIKYDEDINDNTINKLKIKTGEITSYEDFITVINRKKYFLTNSTDIKLIWFAIPYIIHIFKSINYIYSNDIINNILSEYGINVKLKDDDIKCIFTMLSSSMLTTGSLIPLFKENKSEELDLEFINFFIKNYIENDNVYIFITSNDQIAGFSSYHATVNITKSSNMLLNKLFNNKIIQYITMLSYLNKIKSMVNMNSIYEWSNPDPILTSVCVHKFENEYLLYFNINEEDDVNLVLDIKNLFNIYNIEKDYKIFMNGKKYNYMIFEKYYETDTLYPVNVIGSIYLDGYKRKYINTYEYSESKLEFDGSDIKLKLNNSDENRCILYRNVYYHEKKKSTQLSLYISDYFKRNKNNNPNVIGNNIYFNFKNPLIFNIDNFLNSISTNSIYKDSDGITNIYCMCDCTDLFKYFKKEHSINFDKSFYSSKTDKSNLSDTLSINELIQNKNTSMIYAHLCSINDRINDMKNLVHNTTRINIFNYINFDEIDSSILHRRGGTLLTGSLSFLFDDSLKIEDNEKVKIQEYFLLDLSKTPLELFTRILNRYFVDINVILNKKVYLMYDENNKKPDSDKLLKYNIDEFFKYYLNFVRPEKKYFNTSLPVIVDVEILKHPQFHNQYVKYIIENEFKAPSDYVIHSTNVYTHNIQVFDLKIASPNLCLKFMSETLKKEDDCEYEEDSLELTHKDKKVVVKLEENGHKIKNVMFNDSSIIKLIKRFYPNEKYTDDIIKVENGIKNNNFLNDLLDKLGF